MEYSVQGKPAAISANAPGEHSYNPNLKHFLENLHLPGVIVQRNNLKTSFCKLITYYFGPIKQVQS